MSHLFKGGCSQLFIKVTYIAVSLSLFICVKKNENLRDYDLVFTAHYVDKFLNIVQFVKLWDL